MKKSILFLFAFIPLLASCNNNGNGFPNPFPEDTYRPIGFNITDDERVQDTLSSDDITLINSTYANLDEYNKRITMVAGKYRERNYERAFAGEFSKGYSVSNRMYDDDFSIIRAENSADPKFEIRQETNSTSTTVVDYSYGRSTVHSTTQSFHYLAKQDTDLIVNPDPITYEEANNANEAECVLEQIFEIYGAESKTSIGASILQTKSESSNEDPWYDTKHFEIPMTGYIFPTAEASAVPGITKNGEAVLIKETHTPYGEKGIYSLPDGREYEAMVNSIVVSRLVKAPHNVENGDEEDWFIASSVRKYSETAITSDIIQPNVPISYLTNPIVISFVEEEYHFFNTPQSSTATIDEVTI